MEIEMVTAHLYGEPIQIPKVVNDELVRLRAIERQLQDEERERLLREWEARYGPLPDPPSDRQLIEVPLAD